MCDEALDDCLAALKFVPDCFVTSKVNKKNFSTALYTDDNILYFNKVSDNVVFSCNVISILNKDRSNINLDDTNYDKNDPETIIQIRLLV